MLRVFISQRLLALESQSFTSGVFHPDTIVLDFKGP